jgi:hypothetical protein
MLYGTLEWFNKNMEEMIDLKEKLTNKVDLPSFIKKLLEYVRNLTFNEKPDYEYIVYLLEM